MKKIGLILEGQASLYGNDVEGSQYLMDELKKDDVFGEPFYRNRPNIIMYVQRQRTRGDVYRL